MDDIFLEGRIFFIVDIIVELQICIHFIANQQSGVCMKRHREITIEATPILGTHRQGERPIILSNPMPNSEEIPKWYFYTGLCFIVPIHAEHNPAKIIRLVTLGGHPDMVDTPGSLNCTYHPGFTCSDGDEIPVSPGAIVAGNSFSSAIP
jgi:hypothetical protein